MKTVAGADTDAYRPAPARGDRVGRTVIPAPIRTRAKSAKAHPQGRVTRPAPHETFSVRLAVLGGPDWELRTVAVDLQDQLHQREHLASPRVSWDPAGHRIIVEVAVEGPGGGLAAAGVAAELLDLTGASLDESTACRIEVLDVHPTSR